MRVVALAVAAAILVGLAAPAGARPLSQLAVVSGWSHGIYAVVGGPGRPTRHWRIRRPQDTWAYRLSPDVQQVAYNGGVRHPGIYVADRFGRRPGRITKYGADPVWSPDGTRLAFWAWVGAFPGAPGSFQKIFVVDLRTGRVRPLPHTKGDERVLQRAFVEPLAWSADGKSLAFVSPRGLETIRASGGRPHLVHRLVPSRVLIVSVAWSPDDSSFALGVIDQYAEEFDIPPPAPDMLGRIGVNVIRRDGTGLTRIAEGDPNALSRPVGWSPDGKAVTVACATSLKLPPGICAIDTTSRRQRRVLSLIGNEPPVSWSWLAAA